MTVIATESAELPDWATLADHDWPVLLVGNGMSVNLWNGFSYSRLRDKAALSPAATAVFEEIGTTNFEAVLEVIHHAHVVADALDHDTREIDDVYDAVKTALFDAVVGAHVPRDRVPQETKDSYAAELGRHSQIFTTNYDLVTYWSLRGASEDVGVKDFFWQSDQTFNLADTDTSAREFYYLHGAVHLWQDDQGVNGKWTYEAAGNLLSAADNYTPDSPRRPLFVSEGTSSAKLETIRRSQYLSWCLERLRAATQNTVVFGHSLGPQDEHVVCALVAGRPREIAISMWPDADPRVIIEQKAHLRRVFTPHTVQFFDSTTHPLGLGSLALPADPRV